MIDVAIEAAKKGGNLAKNYFKGNPKYILKPDKSPVTRADVESEKIIRKILSKKFPDHGIIGEELAPTNSKSPFQWVIDPIDGTRDYIRQIPYWSVYIALLKDNKPIIGVIYMPETNDVMTAEKGKGTYLNNKKARVSNTKDMDKAYVAFGTIKRFIQHKKFNQLVNVLSPALAGRSYGNLNLKMLLEAKFDVCLEAYGGMHDFAAPAIIVEEAGGKFTDFKGDFSLKTGNGIFSNGVLHKKVLKLLKS